MEKQECRILAGRNLRYLLTETLFGRGPLTVSALVQMLDLGDFAVRGRASKTVSDALRWEIAHGRVVRMGRGLYGPGRMPKQTRSWIRCRVRRLADLSPTYEPRQSINLPTGAAARPGAPIDMTPGMSGATRATRIVPHHGQPDQVTKPNEGAERDEVVVLGGGWNEEEEAAHWTDDIEAVLASLAAEAARANTTTNTTNTTNTNGGPAPDRRNRHVNQTGDGEPAPQ